MNTVNLIGRVVGNPELATTNTGKHVSKFKVAVDNFGKDSGTSFISCVAWNETAKVVVQYTRKGSLIGLSGRLQQREYENKDLQKVNVIEVIVERIDLLEPKAKVEQADEEVKGKNLENLDGNDLPF